MSIKSKLLMCIIGAAIAVTMLVFGVLAVSNQSINMSGDVNFTVADKRIYISDVRLQHGMNQPNTVQGFRPGYVNGEFSLNLDNADLGINNTGTFVLYFDIVNLIVDGSTYECRADAVWTNSPVSGVEFTVENAVIAEGTVEAADRDENTPISGTVALQVNVYDGASFDLSNITISITENKIEFGDFTVAPSNDGSAEITSGTVDASGNLEIPSGFAIVDGQVVEGDDYKVTSVGDSAFIRDKSIKTVTIPDTVTKIGTQSFYACPNLETVVLPPNLEEIGAGAFSDTNLSSIEIPDSVTKIGSQAFKNIDKLTGIINISKNVTSIGYGAFGGTNITGYDVDPNNPNFCDIDGVLFNKDGTILWQYPTGRAGEYVMPESTKVINTQAFVAGKLTDVTFSSGLEQIKGQAFIRCRNLTGEMILPDNVELETGAFSGCNFSAFVASENNARYSTLDGVLFNKSQTRLIQCPAGKSGEYVVPDTVTSINDYAFYRCVQITKITIQSALEYLGGYAFSECTSLGEGQTFVVPDNFTTIRLDTFVGTRFEKIILPENLESISSYVFTRCTELLEITIPSKVTSIGYSAFSNCTKLAKAYIDSQAVAEMLTGTSRTEAGSLLANVALETVYIKDGITGLPEYFTSHFALQGTSDVAGYQMYTKI